MPTTAVQDRLDLDLAGIKGLLGVVENDWDALITLYLEAAKERADTYMNNPFTLSDGTELSIPARVKLGVYEDVYAQWCELVAREREMLDVAADPGQGNELGKVVKGQTIRSIEREDETVTFHSVRDSKARSATPKTNAEIQREFYAAYRLIPGF